MERLTRKESASYDLIKTNNEWCIDYCKEQPIQTCRDCAIHEAIQKLAYYEDLEESRRLVELKCLVGDKVYKIDGGGFNSKYGTMPRNILIMTLVNISISRNQVLYKFTYVDERSNFKELYIEEKELNKESVFLTREEAEVKLMERENG